MIEEDESLYREYNREHNQVYSVFISLFKNRREDIKWFYDNKDKYYKNIISYEIIDENVQFYDSQSMVCHNCIELLKICQNGNYMNAYEYLYVYDYLFLETNDYMLSPNYDDYIKEGSLIKDAMLFIIEIINKTYKHYKSVRTKNRDIFKENNDIIKLLKQYSDDKIFRQEVQNIDEIIYTLEKAGLSNDEDEVYRAYWMVSYIRNSIHLYEKRRDDMEYFHNNRQLSKFINDNSPNSKGVYDVYRGVLLRYIDDYDQSKNFAQLWSDISHNIKEIKDPPIVIKYNDEPIKDFMEWVLSEINKI